MEIKISALPSSINAEQAIMGTKTKFALLPSFDKGEVIVGIRKTISVLFPSPNMAIGDYRDKPVVYIASVSQSKGREGESRIWEIILETIVMIASENGIFQTVDELISLL